MHLFEGVTKRPTSLLNGMNSTNQNPSASTVEPLMLAGYAFEQSDINDVLSLVIQLSNVIGDNGDRLQDEDPESDKSDLYLLGMSALIHNTFAKAYQRLEREIFDEETNDPERAAKIRRFEIALSHFNADSSKAFELISKRAT